MSHRLITIKGEQYTEEDLYFYIQYYKNQNYQPTIHEDLWLNILLQSDMETLKTSCRINKITTKICHKHEFWKMKFEQDGLFYVKDQKSLNQWIHEYTKIKNAMDVSMKLVNYMIDKKRNYFNIISIVDDFDLDEVNWLTPKLNNAIKNSPKQQDRSLIFKVSDFTIQYDYTLIDQYGNELDKHGNIVDDGDYMEYVDQVTKQEFIIYLAKLFYFFPKVEIINQPEDDDDTDVFLSYPNLLNNPKYVKISLPDWV